MWRMTFILFCVCVIAVGDEVILENGHAAFVFSAEYNYGLKRIVNKKTGRSIEFDKPESGKGSPWSIELVEGSRNLHGDKAVTVRRGENSLKLTWENIAYGKNRISVEVTVTLAEDSGIADWQFRALTNGTPAPWIKSVTFPRVDGLKSLGDDYLYYGEYLGRVVRDPSARLTEVIINHPGRWSMQFAAFHGSAKLQANDLVGRQGGFKVNGFHRGAAEDETGLFLAADDGDDHQKTLNLKRNRQGINLWTVHYPALPFWPPESGQRADTFEYEIPYLMKLGTFEGGIGEAANIYRSMTKDRRWLANGKLGTTGNHVAGKVLNCGFWAKFYHGANKVVPEIIRMQEYLQVPVNTHWCRYNVGRFDDNNLDYFPTMANYREGVKTLRKLGVGVAPYVCCAIWDQDTESYRRYGMEQAAALNEFGGKYTWMLAGNQPSSWMNPASPLWRRQYLDATMKMFGQWGTDGQYLDVLACAGKLCYNTDLHKPHGGNYWVEGNRRLLADLRESCSEVEPEPFLTTEGFTENYINQMDAFLTLDITRYGWKNRQPNDVYPIFSLVYHDYAVAYGSDCGQRISAELQRWQMGLSFIWGIQLCYSDYEIGVPGKTLNDRFTRELVHARYRSGHKFLNNGQGIDTAQIPRPELAGSSPVAVISAPLQLKLDTPLSFPWEGPAVPASAWRGHDGTVGIVMANISGADQEIQLALNKAALQAEGNTIWQAWPLPAKIIGKFDADSTLKLQVPADKALILEIRDDSAPEIRPLVTSGYEVALADVKTGTFPEITVSAGDLYGADDVLTENRDGKLQVISRRTGKPMQLDNTPDWRKLEGLGGPRKPDDRTFYALKSTGYQLRGDGIAVVQCYDDVFAAEIEMKSEGEITAPEQAMMIGHDGSRITKGRKITLRPGKYRVMGYSGPVDDPAGVSRDAAEAGRKLLTGPDMLPGETRRRGERLLALGNAMTMVMTGKQARLNHPHDWLLPGRTDELRYEGAPDGTLALLNDQQRERVTIERTTGAFAFTVQGWEAAANLLRVLYEAEVREGDAVYKVTALDYLEVAEPLLAEIDPRDAVITKGAGPGEIQNYITITNTAPFELPIKVSAALPDGWEMPPELNELDFALKAQQKRKVKIVFRNQGGRKAGDHRFRVYVNYSDSPAGAVSEDFMVAERNTNLQAVTASDAAEETDFLNIIRHHGSIAVIAGADKNIALTFRPEKVGRGTPELKWTLLDKTMKTLKSGTIKFKDQDIDLTVPVETAGLYFIRFATNFVRVKVNNGAPHGFSGWVHDPYILHGKEKATLYFTVNQGAKSFEFNGADGGPLEPARIVIRDPNGQVRFNYSGNYSADKWYTVKVPNGMDGKVWRLEITPVEDMQFSFREGVTSWLSPGKNAVLAELP